jgi:hypothetical protein
MTLLYSRNAGHIVIPPADCRLSADMPRLANGIKFKQKIIRMLAKYLSKRCRRSGPERFVDMAAEPFGGLFIS